MKKLFTLITIISYHVCLAQQEANHWYFGQNAGIDFTSGTPLAANLSSIVTTEGSSTISDAAGNLLFYTNGVDVWDRNHMQMDNGFGLMGGISSTQSALIVPQPGSSTLYYVFTVDETGGGNGFRYSIVDISLNSGKGDVSQKNVPIFSPVTEKLTAIKNFSINNYWMLVHEWGTDAFHVYELTSAGFNNSPVISNIGSVHNTNAIQNSYGQMKFSPCGDKVALAIGYQNTVEVFDFNNSTGVLSNALTIAMSDHVYGVEFSPDNSKLYVSTYDPSATLIQFDLSAGSSTAIIASQTTISQTPDIYPLQLAPDGKIYVVKSWNQWLGIISSPNLAGTASNYVDMGVDVDPNFVGANPALSLPNFVQSIFRNENECTTTSITESLNKDLFRIFPNPGTGNIMITSDKLLFPLQLQIQNILGEVISELMINTSTVSLKLDAGIYFVTINDGRSRAVEKLIIEK